MKGLLWLGVIVSLASLILRLPLAQVTVGCVGGVALILAWRQSRDAAAFLLGLFLPLLPVFGSGTLLLAVSAFSLAVWSSVSTKLLDPWMPLLGLALVSVAVQGIADGWAVDWYTALAIEFEGPWQGLLRLRELVRAAPPVAFLASEEWLRIAIIAIGFALWDRVPGAFARGLLWGLLGAAVVTSCEILQLLPTALPNQNAFWGQLRRPVGSFSDPNSMGIFLVLGLPYLWWRRRELGVLTTWGVALWVVLGVFSGSRSYVIGMLALGAVELYRWSPRLFRRSVVCASVLLLTLNLVHELAPAPVDAGLAHLPSSLERVCQSLVISQAHETFSSRLIFWEIAGRIWLDAPGFGIGFGRIRELIPWYSLGVAPHIGMYTDNANNFYLGILAELGLVGLMALLWLGAGLRREFGDPRLPLLVGIFAVLLLFGPHVAFDEVAVLFSLILAEGFGVRKYPSLPLSVGSVILGLGAGVTFLSGNWGLHAVEQEGRAVRRWTMQRAQVWLACDATGNAQLTMRAIQPGLTTDPLSVLIATSSGAQWVRRISDNQWATTEIPCGAEKRSVRVRLTPSRAWIPRFSGVGVDSRVLGVQLELPLRVSAGRLSPHVTP